MRVVAAIVILGSYIMSGFAHAEVSGSVDRPAFYRGSLQLGSEASDGCELTISLDPVLFEVHTLQGKYRAVRIRVDNTSGNPVMLSHRADRLKVRLRDGREAIAVIDLQQADGPVWDRLDNDTRKALAYPKSIPAGEEVTMGRRLSRMSFFVFLPATVVEPPTSFELRIDSLHRSLLIAPPPATAS